MRQNGDLCVVIEFQRVSPGKGSSFVRTRLKTLKTNKVNEVTFKSAETVDFEDVQYQKMQYLFADDQFVTFMDTTTYEQVVMSKEDIGPDEKFLKEGLEVTVVMHDGQALTIELPRKISYTVKYTEPAVKGDTTSGNVMKDAELDQGLTVRVPIFIKEGDLISINTEDASYVERITE